MESMRQIQAYINGILSQIEVDAQREAAYRRTYGVAQYCALLAAQRGLRTELAYAAGLLHNAYEYRTGSRMCLGQNGAEMVRVALRKIDLSADEKILIQSAIYHHEDKAHVHDEYDEVLKDADLLQCLPNGAHMQIHESALPRLENVLKSLNLPPYEKPQKNSTHDEGDRSAFRRSCMVDTARTVAGKNVQGQKNDADFLSMIRYFPEATAYDEFLYAWCAAFVYHCALEAGLVLPIRHRPNSNTRFACVGAWLKWGQERGFCFFEKDGFSPLSGDIVIYNNIIPKEKKPENTPWYDHMGIVLAVEPFGLKVAEGNVGNGNVAGIVERTRDETIGCYLRIPDGYLHDGWKYDYKTGKLRMVDYPGEL